MSRYFTKKRKENFLVCIGALTSGILSFVITLNVYPKINKKQEKELVDTAQIEVVANIKNDNLNIDKKIKVEENQIETEVITVEKSDEITIVENKKISSLNKTENTHKRKQDFDFPLSGDIIKDFSNDSLVYSKTLNEWCTHEGIDIAGNEGDVIVSIEDGIVEQVFEDEKYGKTIVVAHENGYQSVYSFVESQDFVSEKQKIRKGEAIGRLITNTGFEAKDEAHLHFEIIKAGLNLSPFAEILK